MEKSGLTGQRRGVNSVNPGHDSSVVPTEQDRLDEEFWVVAKPSSEPLAYPWFGPLLLLIATLATPWYLPSSVASILWLGLPVWVWVTLGGALLLAAASCYGALVLWREDPPS